MAQDPNALIWIDMEMSGLNPETDRVLEVAIVITDAQLNTVAESPALVVHQPEQVDAQKVRPDRPRQGFHAE
jgi:oligoribonuclease